MPVGREVLVEVRAVGLCPTDRHFASAGFGYHFPAVLGHEVAGIVRAIGSDVVSVRTGDHVVACLVSFCGVCSRCLSGRSSLCEAPGITARDQTMPARLVDADGNGINQMYGIGGFAEQCLVHENQLAVVDPVVPFAQACLIGCAVVTGAGAVINTAGLRVGETVAIIGVGGAGLNAVSGARLAGASKIIAIDIDETKLALAQRFGATDVLNSRSVDAVAEVKALTRGGVDYSFEVTGLKVAQEQAVQMLRAGGEACFVGLSAPGSTLTLDTSLAMLLGQTGVRGVRMGSVNIKRDIPMYADFYLQGRLNLDDLITREIGLDQIDEAYEQLSHGGSIRSVVTSF